MKFKRTIVYCLSKACTWEQTSNKNIDAIVCPKCKGLVNEKEMEKWIITKHTLF